MPTVGGVEAGEGEQVDQALVDAGNEVGEHQRVVIGLPYAPDQPVDPFLPGVADPEHVGLLGEPHRFVDAARVIAGGLRHLVAVAAAEVAQRPQQQEQPGGDHDDDQRRHGVEHERRGDEDEEGQQRHHQRGRRASAGGRLPDLVGRELLQVPLEVARLHGPGGARKGGEQFAAQLFLHVGRDPRRHDGDDRLQGEAEKREREAEGQQGAETHVQVQGADVDVNPGRALNEGRGDLGENGEDPRFRQPGEHRAGPERRDPTAAATEQRAEPRPRVRSRHRPPMPRAHRYPLAAGRDRRSAPRDASAVLNRSPNCRIASSRTSSAGIPILSVTVPESALGVTDLRRNSSSDFA